MAVSGAPEGLASQRPWTAFSALGVGPATPARRRLATNAERQAECLLINDLISHSNGNDNSYGLRIWDSQGTVVRNNRVFDSVYWGGVSNSKGITFMVSKIGDPNIVEHNEIHDIPGFAAVGTKGGVSGLIVRHNYIHDVYAAIEPGDERCVWSSDNPTCEPTDDEYRPGGEWEIYGNIIVGAEVGLRLPGFTSDGHGNRAFNNVFHQCRTGIEIGWDGSYGNVFANNVFSANEAGFYLRSGGTDTVVADYLDQFASDHNLFFDNSLADIHLRPNWGGGYSSGTPYFLPAIRDQFERELDSIAADPRFVGAPADFHLETESPAQAAGDASFWPAAPAVDIGAYPFGSLLFFDDFEQRPGGP